MAEEVSTNSSKTSLVDTVKDKVSSSVQSATDSTISGIGTFEEKLAIGAGPLDWLRHINAWLEGMPRTVVEYFDTVFKSGESFSQKAVDMICEYAAWFVNYNVEKMRQGVVKSLYEQYGIMRVIQQKLQVVKNFFTNPLSILGAVASAVKAILNIFLGPLVFVIAYIYNVVKEVVKLAENLANIAAVLPPDPPDPNLNFNAFKLQLGKMGVSTLTDDPSQLPTPIEMFPEPIKPFTPAYWKALGSETARTYRTEKAFYKLPDEDFATKMAHKYNEAKLAVSNLNTTKLSGDNGTINDDIV